MGKNVLEVSRLTKEYRDLRAVDQISFGVKKGEILGLLGPNGAGKTTTIQMLLGLTLPTSGKIKYFGRDFLKNRSEILKRINFSSTYTNMQRRLSVWQSLRVYGGFYGIKNIEKQIKEVVEILEIEPFLDKLFWKLSSGQRTQVNLARSLMNDPELMLMDEPTASLDPEVRFRVLELVKRLQKTKKMSVLYTSHDMDEVARVCDRVIFLDKGKIVAEDSPLGLTKRVGSSKLEITFDGKQNAVEKYLKSEKRKYEFTRKHVVEINLREADVPKVLFGLSKVGVWMTDIDIKKPNLEDVFLSVAQGDRDVMEKN